MAEFEFDVVYAGPEVDSGRMPVRTLAPSLLALADLLHSAQAVLYPEDPPIDVEIVASRTGSVEISLVAEHLPAAAGTAATLLASQGVDAAANLAQLAQTVAGVLGWIRNLRGRPIKEVVVRRPRSFVKVQEGEETVLEVELEHDEAVLIRERVIRRQAEQFTQPLDAVVERVEVRVANRTAEIGREDRPSFEALLAETEQVESWVSHPRWTIRSPSFDRDLLWRLTSPEGQNYNVKITDETFWQRIEDGEQFGAGDHLDLELHTEQRIVDDKPVPRHVATRVRHIPRSSSEQSQLPDPDDT